MKVTKSDYSDLREALKRVMIPYGITAVLKYKEELKSDTRVKDLEVRFVWDMFWSIGVNVRTLILERMRSYQCNDNHIETALKKAITEILEQMSQTQKELDYTFRAKVMHL